MKFVFLRSRNFKAWKKEALALLALALPIVATQLAQVAIMTTDVVILVRFQLQALAAAALGNSLYFIYWFLALGPIQAVSPIAAKAVGHDGRRTKALISDIRKLGRMGLWTAGLVSIPVCCMLLLTKPILSCFAQDKTLIEGAGLFTAGLAIGVPFSFGFQALRNLTIALGHPKESFFVMMATVIWNAIFNYALVFGGHIPYLPNMHWSGLGLIGAGLGTSLSHIFAFFALLSVTLLKKDLKVYRLLRRFFRCKMSLLKEIFWLGFPIGMTALFEILMFNAMTLVMGLFGPMALSAHQIAINIASIAFMVPLGTGMGVTIRVAQELGAENRKGVRRAGLVALTIGVGMALISAFVMGIFGQDLAGLYLGDETSSRAHQVTIMAQQFLYIAAGFQVFDALQTIANQALRGLQDTKIPMILAGLGYWLLGVPMCLWLGFGLKLEGLGVWLGLAFGLGITALAMCTRFHLLTRSI